MNCVLIIDDDVKLCELVMEYLHCEGLEPHAVHDGETGLQEALTRAYAMVVLDVMLPGIGGFEVLRRIRAAKGAAAELPVLMLTARGDEVDRVLGLEFGADDYLAKPFSSRELVARLRAITRRLQVAREISLAALDEPMPFQALRLGDVELNAATHEVHCGKTSIELTTSEFTVLELLLRTAGTIVTRETISKTALGRSLLPYDRSIDVHVSNLRRKLGPTAQGGERVKSVRGVGYLYVLPEAAEAAAPRADDRATG